MKTILCVVLLCIIESFSIQASPTVSEKDYTKAVNFPANEGPIENEDIKISNHYIPTPGIGIHKFHKSQKKSWNDARNTCLNEGGHLAVINSVAEEMLIVKYMNITGNIAVDQLWIGVHELFKKDEWVSVKDERFDAIGYAHWMAGQPDSTPNEHCLTITQYGMNDFVCDIPLFFVCEMQFIA